MDFHVTLTGRGELASQIYREILEAVLDGRLRPGERLPPTRELAVRLEVSRNTVAVAYERLVAEGFLTAHVGAGTFVSDEPLGGRRRARRAPAQGITPRPLWSELLGDGHAGREQAGATSVQVDGGRESARPSGASQEGREAEFDFSVGVPDAGLFPMRTWRRLVSYELHSDALLTGGYGDVGGHPGLRSEIARFVGVSRSVKAAADDVIVTRGAQQAFDLIARVLVGPGDCVAVEEPGYPPLRELLTSLGARVVLVPVDDEGLVISALPAQARLVYVTPSHQFPMGAPMSLARRTALLDWAQRQDAAVIEDDYDSEFRFADRPLEPLQSIDRSGRVIYVGSFSKTLLPALRLGFLVAPASLRDALHAAKRLSDWRTEPTSQGALARFIAEGLLGRHIRKATRVYAARHEVITDLVRRDFAGILEVVPSMAGLHLCMRTAPGIDPEEVVRSAGQAGVRVESLTSYCGRGRTDRSNGLVLGYGAISADRIPEGLRRLRQALPDA